MELQDTLSPSGISSHYGLRPIYVDSQHIYIHKSGCIYVASLNLESIRLLSRLPSENWVLSTFSKRSRLVSRFFRCDVVVCEKFAVEYLMILRDGCIWQINIQSGETVLSLRIPNGRKALSLTSYCFQGEEILIFGEYFSNPSKSEVGIWLITSSLQWRRYSLFSAGLVNHIHSISVVDNQLFILTGDDNTASRIWSLDLNTMSVSPLTPCAQLYRAAWMHQFNGKALYATDTQLDLNYLCELDLVSGRSTKLCSLPGSSIYAASSSHALFFSTSVECDEPGPSLVRNLLDVRRGPGILDDYSRVYMLGKDMLPRLLYIDKKDFLPHRLFRFGSFTFPAGSMPESQLFCFGESLVNSDNVLLSIPL